MSFTDRLFQMRQRGMISMPVEQNMDLSVRDLEAKLCLCKATTSAKNNLVHLDLWI